MRPPLTRSDLDTAFARLKAGATVGAAWLAPHVARANGMVRRSPRLATALDATVAAWRRLVEAFCATIDPVLARWFPEHRLVVTLAADGSPVLHRIVTSAAGVPDVTPQASDPAALAAVEWTAIELRLPPGQILRRSLSLPGASRDFLGSIIEHRLERLTPWKPDRVLYGYRLAEPTEAGAVTVDFAATSRDIVATPLATLAALGLAPTAIGAEGAGPAEPLGIDLQRGGAAPARARSRTIVSRIALAGFAALAVLAVGTSLVAASADAARDETSAKLVKARRLLRNASLGTVGEREKAMLEAKQPDRAMMVLVDRLAGAIPADTFLRELAVSRQKVRLVGASGNAPALVGKLEAAGLRNVRFTAAITRGKDGRDSFEIGADRATDEPIP